MWNCVGVKSSSGPQEGQVKDQGLDWSIGILMMPQQEALAAGLFGVFSGSYENVPIKFDSPSDGVRWMHQSAEAQQKDERTSSVSERDIYI